MVIASVAASLTSATTKAVQIQVFHQLFYAVKCFEMYLCFSSGGSASG